MVQATFHFPLGFLWGTATASHQVEGKNTNNNWWAWENEGGRIHNEHRSGLACDWWSGRWQEDFDRAAQAGQNAHRLSLEWSRIQPTPNHWDEDALDYYREMIIGLRERNMIPMITLHHFCDPIWFTELGGWENEASGQWFEAYARKAVEALHEYVDLWVTINEPNVLAASGYVLGVFPPGKKDFGAAFTVMENLVRAHAAAYRAIHSAQQNARVGVAHHYRGFRPARTWYPLDRLFAQINSRLFNDLIPFALKDGTLRRPGLRKKIREAKGTQDFFGVNYYTRECVAFNLLSPGELFSKRFYPEESELSDTGFIANDPEGMHEALKWAMQFKLPIIITENGVEDADDDLRPKYLIEHLHQVWRAVNFSWPVQGYFHWSLVDNFEWERGWSQRFGLWELDVETLGRRKRPSADLYARICEENGISTEMVAEYAPELVQQLFPG